MTTTALDGVPDLARFERDWEDWHRAHETRRADPHGFLAVTGLYWLTEHPLELPGVPGVWRTGARGPVVDRLSGAALSVDSVALAEPHAFGPIPERGGVTAAFAGGVVEIARRGGRDILRPRHPDHTYLSAYAGTPAYAPDPRWRFAARFVPHAAPRPVQVGAAVDGLRHVYESPGYLEFALGTEIVRLVAFPGDPGGALSVVFSDATSGISTYGANRTVHIDAPDARGAAIVDFNRAVNLPCAYTDFATCPLPPAENRLPVAVEAGEKTPLARVHGIVTDIGVVPLRAVA